jgi:hypothetical protein
VQRMIDADLGQGDPSKLHARGQLAIRLGGRDGKWNALGFPKNGATPFCVSRAGWGTRRLVDTSIPQEDD